MMSKNKKLAKAKADKYFSEYIRKRDADANGYCKCCTCSKKAYWKEVDAGHFISRRHEGTRYNEKNANAQCAFCNRFDQGRQFQHGEFIKKKYGEGTTDILWRDALWTTRRTQYDYEMIALEFKDKAKNL
jgi:hypothetical protein